MNQNINIFNVTKYVRQALTSDTLLAKNAISPIIVKEGTKLPFITIQKIGGLKDYNKDWLTSTNASVRISVFAESYDKVCELTELIDKAMDENFNKAKTRAILTHLSEDWSEEVFVGQMEYSFVL